MLLSTYTILYMSFNAFRSIRVQKTRPSAPNPLEYPIKSKSRIRSHSFTSNLTFHNILVTMKTETMISALVALMLASAAYAAKDDSYYSDGVTNPNVKERMYWHAPYNVLQDLSQFKKLYVKHHACV
jgi:hypothetical protein